MSLFTNIRCIARDGSSAPLDPSHKDSAFTGQSRLALHVINSKIYKIRWEYSGNTKEVSFDHVASAAIDPRSDLLVVSLYFSEPQFKRPRNAVVVNPDGTLNHQISPPKCVSLPDDEKPTVQYPVEAILETFRQDGRIVMGLNYCYEMVERRFYDPAKREWLERDQLYRR